MQQFPPFHRNSSSTELCTARDRLSDILNKHYTASAAPAAAAAGQNRTKKSGEKRTEKGQERARGERMPSSKGKPTDPELREEVKEEVKAEEKGGGPGSWSAWKAGEMARRYEARGGGYEDTGNNKNKAKKGEPEKK